MKTIKIIFFDIDGTLIDMNKKQISQKMLETLKRLKENQIRICLATGRTPMSVLQRIKIFQTSLFHLMMFNKLFKMPKNYIDHYPLLQKTELPAMEKMMIWYNILTLPK